MLPPDIDGARILYIELAMRQLPLFVNSRAKAAAFRERRTWIWPRNAPVAARPLAPSMALN
jgi:hypothetical protein